MTCTKSAPGARPAAKETTFLIEVADKDAGLAVMESGCARFIASDPAFMALDNRHFRDLAALVKAAEALDQKRRSGAETRAAPESVRSDRVVA